MALTAYQFAKLNSLLCLGLLAVNRCFALKHPDVAQHGDVHGVRVGFDFIKPCGSAAHVDSDFDLVDLVEGESCHPSFSRDRLNFPTITPSWRLHS